MALTGTCVSALWLGTLRRAAAPLTPFLNTVAEQSTDKMIARPAASFFGRTVLCFILTGCHAAQAEEVMPFCLHGETGDSMEALSKGGCDACRAGSGEPRAGMPVEHGRR